jgi:hypothetical protein
MGMIARQAARARELLLPWSGIIGASFGWMLSQQIGSMQSFDNCRGTDPLLVLIIGLLGLALTTAGGWIALLVWRDRQSPSHGARRFIAIVGAGLAALCAIAIILQTAASLIIPRCFG